LQAQQLQPLVAYETTANSESVLTVLQRLNNRNYSIAEYQRDSDQWDPEAKSLFVESALNNLPAPAILLAPTSDGKFEIIDGQQRLTTIKEYYEGKWALADSDDAPYLGQRSAHYAGRKFQELRLNAPAFAQAFENYMLHLIKLPPGIPDSTKREIFRRINQAGTPLSAQDIRLAYYGDCRTVSFIRLTGIYDENREASRRMIDVANRDYGLHWPWEGVPQQVRDNWNRWWAGKQTAVGQTASEMFLWYLIAKYVAEIDSLLSNQTHLASSLNVAFDGRTEEVADIFAAQLKHESGHMSTPNILCTSVDLRDRLFPVFATWWSQVNNMIPNIGVDRYRRVALLIAALSGQDPSTLNVNQWDMMERFLRSSRQTAQDLGIVLPEAKGKWGGQKGQKGQIIAYRDVAKTILALP